ncbi:MAG: ABC transporter permease [Deltaproteobacteria bacterium]|nr:ABC transporter permease [Deltaproteobacteria bacterium]
MIIKRAQLKKIKAPIIVAGIIGLFFIVTAIFAPLIAPHEPLKGSLSERLIPPVWQKGGDPSHILGTDILGRDVLSRLIYGTRTTLAVCVLAIFISGTIGSLLGMISGYFGGWTDIIIMRAVDMVLSIPVILLALLFAIVFGPSFLNIIVVISLILWSQYARMARGETLKIKELDYVNLARTAGCSHARIMARHILPNIASPLVILATLQVGTVIILESSLSFLGVGIPPTTPDWGNMVAEGRSYIVSAWWLCMVPGAAILLTVLSFNLVGDFLTDYINPELRRE